MAPLMIYCIAAEIDIRFKILPADIVKEGWHVMSDNVKRLFWVVLSNTPPLSLLSEIVIFNKFYN